MRSPLYIALLFVLSACASTGNVASFNSADDTANLQEKEERLWHEAVEIDDTLDRSGQIFQHDKATAYIQSVMDKLFPEFKGKIVVHIYDSTELNAFALPNGSVYFNIGLLARIENEAQLAAVLAHEASHFIEKHSFKERVRIKNAAAFALSGVPFSSLAAVSSISGFSQDLEREADAKGYERLVKAGYTPKEAHKVFEHLADEVQLLEIEEPYFYSSHPSLKERIDEFKKLSADYHGNGVVGEKSYNSVITPLRLDALRKDIGQDRFKSVIHVLEDSNKMSLYPSASYYYLGEAYMRRDEDGDEAKAVKAYKQAEKLAPKFSPTYMRLGMHYMKKGDKGKAKRYFKKYLSVAPRDARERDYARQYLKSL